MLAGTISILTFTSNDKYDPSTSKAHCCANNIFENSSTENNYICFPLTIFNFLIEQKKYPRQVN